MGEIRMKQILTTDVLSRREEQAACLPKARRLGFRAVADGPRTFVFDTQARARHAHLLQALSRRGLLARPAIRTATVPDLTLPGPARAWGSA